jgi:hypothetical protein
MDGHGLKISQPFPIELAREQIAGHQAQWASGKSLWLAVCEHDGPLVGSVELSVGAGGGEGGFGYWLSADHWGRGYMTEALQAVVEYGSRLGIGRFKASCLATNLASRRVLEKLGMKQTAASEAVGHYRLDLQRAPPEPPLGLPPHAVIPIATKASIPADRTPITPRLEHTGSNRVQLGLVPHLGRHDHHVRVSVGSRARDPDDVADALSRACYTACS